MTPSHLVADLHLHSRYAMATSPQLNLQALASAAAEKGITLLAAPDFTHPAWREEMRAELEPAGEGVYRAHGALFTLVTEVSCVWTQGGRGRRVHFLLMASSLEAADRISAALSRRHDLESDGRPALGISARQLYALALEADEQSVLFPAHAWTPWYGVYGSKSGFDSLEEAFGEYTSLVPAIETGLSSDPAMNWAVPDIGSRAIVSFSDAHSPGTIGRELTVIEAEPSYLSIRSALFENRVVETVEFHPEHGKYHFNGHRKCGVRFSPEETPADRRCPVCRRPLTMGVLQRVIELSSDRPEVTRKGDGLTFGPADRAPFRSLVPLRELLSEALGTGVNTGRVAKVYASLVKGLGGEMNILTSVPGADIARLAGERAAQAVMAVRTGNVRLDPGYDGVYGSVKALPEERLPLLAGHV